MTLSDEMAKLLMGEIDVTVKQIEEQIVKSNSLNKSIDSQIAGLNEVDKKLAATKVSIIEVVAQTKEVHNAHISDELALASKKLEAVSAEKFDAFAKNATSTSQALVVDIVRSAEETKAKMLEDLGNEAVRIVRDRVARENTSLSEASKALYDLTEAYKAEMVKRNEDAVKAVSTFSVDLQKTIKAHAPMGRVGQIVWMFVSAVIGAVAIVLALQQGFLPTPEKVALSAQDQDSLNRGKTYDKIYNNLDAHTQSNIHKNWPK